MGSTISQRIVESLPFLDGISDRVQPKVREAVEAGGTTARNVLDGTPVELPLHPLLTDVPAGSWTAALVFDGLDLATGSKAMRNAADASLAVGVAGAFAAAITGLSDWRYLSGGARRMGMAHGLLNTVGLVFSVASLVLRAAGRRNAGRLAFLVGFSISGTAMHLGGELSYNYGLRMNRAVAVPPGPADFTAALPDADLPPSGVRGVKVDGAKILLARSEGGEVCALSSVCTHMGGALEDGRREGDTIICPLHGSRFDLRTGAVVDGPAVFPQPRYETRVRDGRIEVRSEPENVQELVR